MTNAPPGLPFNCVSQLSCVARLEVRSDSAKFRIASRKEGVDPVVRALTLGIVIVGEVAWAVKGMAAPDRMTLAHHMSYQEDRLKISGYL